MVGERCNDEVDLANLGQDLEVNGREVRKDRFERLASSASAGYTGHLNVRVICQNARRFSAGIARHVDNSNARCSHNRSPREPLDYSKGVPGSLE